MVAGCSGGNRKRVARSEILKEGRQ